MNRASTIMLSSEERSTLEVWSRGRSLPLRLVQRARIIQMAADGALNQTIADALNISRPTVQLWRDRFMALRLAGLEKDAPRPGRIPKIPQAPSGSRGGGDASHHTSKRDSLERAIHGQSPGAEPHDRPTYLEAI